MKATDIQKMIEEEASWYRQKVHQERVVLAKSYIDSIDIALAVKHGANFALSKLQHANRWRKVGEELPEMAIQIILKLYDRDIILGYYLDHKYREDSFYTINENDIEFLIEGVTEWKPIG